MKRIFVIVAVAAAGLASSAANAGSTNRHPVGAGIMRHASGTVNRTDYQSLYQGGGSFYNCDGQRVFGFCPVR